jgi:hypothetical protein
LFDALRDDELLAPLLHAAARQLRYLPCGVCTRLTARSDFLRGMWADDLKRDITGQEQQLLHAPGRVAAGHPMPGGLVKLLGSDGFACSVWLRSWGGSIRCCSWRPEGWILDDVACAGAAAAGGHLEMIRWLAGRGRVPTAPPRSTGHLHVLEWAAANGCAAPANACLEAAVAGHMQVLRWLLQTQPRPWHDALDVHCCRFAAQRGDLAMLQLLRAHGCPWDLRTGDAATRGGHCHILAWARFRTSRAPERGPLHRCSDSRFGWSAAVAAGAAAALPVGRDNVRCRGKQRRFRCPAVAAGTGAVLSLGWQCETSRSPGTTPRCDRLGP